MYLSKAQTQVHEEGAWCLAWLGETKLATGSVDETVRVWDVTNLAGGTICTFSNHELAVVSLAVKPDTENQILSSSSMDGCIRTFDLTSQTLVSTIVADPGQNWCIRYNPVSSSTLASSCQNGMVLLYDLRDVSSPPQQSFQSFDTKAGFGFCVNWSSDGRHLVVGSANGSVTILDTRHSLQPLHTISCAHSQAVRACVFSPDSNSLVTGSEDMFISKFEAKYGQRTSTLTGHVSQVSDLAFHPDNTHIASAGSDRKVKLWDTLSKECVHTFDVHEDEVWCVEFSPDGGKIASVGDDGKLHIASCQFER